MDDSGAVKLRRKKTFSLEEKVGFALILVIGLVGAVLGAINLPASIRRPFDEQLASYTGPEFQTLTQRETKLAEEQKVTDTDGDGLMDYDELYVFKTSAYLNDSDSDGLTDQQEVYGGTDPNCPEGKDCGRTMVQSADAAGNPSGDPVAFLSSALNVDASRFNGLTFTSLDDIRSFFSRLSIQEIRDMLKSQGVPEATLNAMSDDDLKAVFSSAIDQAASTGQLDQLLQGTDTTAASGSTDTGTSTTTTP